MAYNAVISKIYVSPHPNADRLQLGRTMNALVIVDLNTQNGDLGVFFESDGQLSEEFCKTHDLISRVDDSGNKVGGYFSEKRRVRAQKMRGVKSEGFWMPISCLEYTGVDLKTLKEGQTFTEINGHKICQKYYTPRTLKAMDRLQKQQKSEKNKTICFPKHYDTTQFRFAMPKVGDNIYISGKLHGTSFRYGNVKVTEKPTGIRALANKVIPNLFKNKVYNEYTLGTRNAVLEKGKDEYSFIGGFYGQGEPYATVPQILYGKLKENEIVYGEVCGYCNNGSPLFSQPVNDKELSKKYGKSMIYSYGCSVGQSRFFIYRITQDGVELSNWQMLQRARELGVEVVPQLYHETFNGNLDELQSKIDGMLEGNDWLDDKHIREGVCIRIESPIDGFRIYKEKAFTFKVLEGIIKDKDDYVDLEEVS